MNSGAFSKVIILSESANINIRKEAIHVICNSIAGADAHLRTQIYRSSDGKVFKVLTSALSMTDEKVLTNVLDVFVLIFDMGQDSHLTEY